MSTILQLAKGNASGIEIDSGSTHNADCMACVEGKQHWLPFMSGCTQATCISKSLHMDPMGPIEVASFDNKHYFLIIIDDYSCAVWTSPIASKTKVMQKVQEYVAQLENTFVKVADREDIALEEWVSPEMDGLGLSLCAVPSCNRLS
jgi:hypothetical protein